MGAGAKSRQNGGSQLADPGCERRLRQARQEGLKGAQVHANQATKFRL